MVNTFLIYPNWIQSARRLDKKRIWKQVVEARQILQLIIDLKHIISFANFSYSNWEDIKSLIKDYKSSDKVFVRDENNNYQLILKSISSNFLSYNNNFKEVKLGFVYHPVVKMWWSYTEALKFYINIHITECISRGMKSDISKYYVTLNCMTNDELNTCYNNLTQQQICDINYIIIPNKIKHPVFVYNQQLYSIYRSNLKLKDPQYYSDFSEEPSKGYHYELFYDPIFQDDNMLFQFNR